MTAIIGSILEFRNIFFFISSIQNKILLLTYHDSTIILWNRFIPIFDVKAVLQTTDLNDGLKEFTAMSTWQSRYIQRKKACL